MSLKLNHKSLDVYKVASQLLKECYTVSKKLPTEERFNLCTQLTRAALSVKLNISEGSSRKSPAERKRFYEVSRGSVVEIDAISEVISDLGYLKPDELTQLDIFLNKTFHMLTKMIR